MILGELVGRYLNDWIMNFSIRRNKGVFEAESRLWYCPLLFSSPQTSLIITFRTCYLAVLLYTVGFIVLGAAIRNHLNVGAVIMGWGIAELAIMINTVAVYAYCNDCFPKHQVRVRTLL